MTKLQQIRFLINEPRYEGRVLLAKLALTGAALWLYWEVISSALRVIAS